MKRVLATDVLECPRCRGPMRILAAIHPPEATLALQLKPRAVFPKLPYTSLEAPDVRAFATEDPRGFLAQFPKGAILDEVQRTPGLPSYLQGLIDADPTPGRWILTGSQNLALLEPISQSLAGRTAVLHLLPLARSEVIRFPRHPEALNETLLAGGYPRIFDRELDPSD